MTPPTPRKTFAKECLNQFETQDPVDSFRCIPELCRRLERACSFLRTQHAFKDKWANEAQELADELDKLLEKD